MSADKKLEPGDGLAMSSLCDEPFIHRDLVSEEVDVEPVHVQASAELRISMSKQVLMARYNAHGQVVEQKSLLKEEVFGAMSLAVDDHYTILPLWFGNDKAKSFEGMFYFEGKSDWDDLMKQVGFTITTKSGKNVIEFTQAGTVNVIATCKLSSKATDENKGTCIWFASQLDQFD